MLKVSNWGASKGDSCILVYLEHREGRLLPVSQATASVGASIAEGMSLPWKAFLHCQLRENMHIEEAYYLGAREVLVCDVLAATEPSLERIAFPLIDVAKQLIPRVILLPGTQLGNDLAGCLAAELRAGAILNCSSIELDADQNLIARHPKYTNQITELISWSQDELVVVTLRMSGSPPRKINHPNPSLIKTILCPELPIAPVTYLGEQTGIKEPPSLSEASLVVSGGRGVGGKEAFASLEKLANVLGGAVGSSLSAVEEGWADRKSLIGQTGSLISPRLLIAMGISGSIHHLVGIRDSHSIIAVNKDRSAPIFSMATLRVVGDLQEILSALIQTVEKEVQKVTSGDEA